jgi:aminotransferase
MSIECERVGGINLAQGICDTEPPAPVIEGASGAIRAGVNSYTRFDGLPLLRQSIAAKAREYNRIEADPERQIIVTPGSTGAFYAACLALLDPGDEVIVFEPYYGYHLNTLLSVGAVPAYVTLEPPDWSFSREQVERVISPRTRAIVVCTPANPSGKVFTREEIEWIIDLALRHDIFVFTDEIYEYFLYDGRKHVSPGSYSEVADRTLTISGYSKTFSITGWRIGYVICDERWARVIGPMIDLVYVCAPAPLQQGVATGIAALRSDYYEEVAADYAAKRDRICGVLEAVGLTPYVPQGAYYVLADASRLSGESSKEKAMHLLSKTGVATVPGGAFYHGEAGESLLRFCFAKTDRDLDEACARLERLGSR